jgi:hypothetical protein
LESLPERLIPQWTIRHEFVGQNSPRRSLTRQPDAAKFRKHILGKSFSVVADRQLNASFASHNLNIDDLGCQ